MTLTVHIPGRPVAQARARTGGGHFYDPAESSDWKRSVSLIASAKYRRDPLTGLVVLHIVCRFTPPKSLPVKVRRMVEIGAMVPARTNIDTDNLAKAVMDALTGVLYGNDHQVWWLSVRKIYGEPGVTITVESDE